MSKRTPNGQKTSAAGIDQAERVARALDLRRQGWSFGEIAAELGWESRQAAFAAVSKALQETVSEPAAEVRTLELMRLDRLEKLLWPRAEAGDPKAVDRLLKVQERRARLLGLDAPTKLANADGSNLPAAVSITLVDPQKVVTVPATMPGSVG